MMEKTKSEIYMEKTATHRMVEVALMTAVLCILAPLSIPIGPVPVSLLFLILFLMLYILGTKYSLVCFGIYFLLGLVGLPVFTGYAGGLGKIAGPTGGYLVGSFLLILIGGFFVEKFQNQRLLPALGMVLGGAASYVFGTVWFMVQASCDLAYAMSVCVLPFIPIDLIKIAIAVIIGPMIRKRLKMAGLI